MSCTLCNTLFSKCQPDITNFPRKKKRTESSIDAALQRKTTRNDWQFSLLRYAPMVRQLKGPHNILHSKIACNNVLAAAVSYQVLVQCFKIRFIAKFRDLLERKKRKKGVKKACKNNSEFLQHMTEKMQVLKKKLKIRVKFF